MFLLCFIFFFFKQKTAYEMRISDWSSDVCSSDLMGIPGLLEASAKTHTELRKRGIRHLIGGDYGFKWSPNGSNARDLDFFVKYYGYTRAEEIGRASCRERVCQYV